MDTKRKIMKMAEGNVAIWAVANQFFLPTAGKVFSFKDHEYMEEPYLVDAPLLVFEKGAQLGFSERAVIKVLHGCIYRFNSGVIYYFPTKYDVTDFSKARFAPMIDMNPFLKAQVKDTDSANIKRVGKCMLYLRGLRSSVSAKSAPADKLVFDEIDEAPPDRVDLAKKRLSHSEFQEIEALSTPTIPDYGIDALFQLTDQRYRHLFCEACRTYTCLEKDFPDCMAEWKDGTVTRVCKKCNKALNLAHPRNEYVADYPGKLHDGRPAVGYRVSQLQSTHVSMAEIMREYQDGRFVQDFYNSRMAQPYIDASNRLDVAHVLGLCGSHGMEYQSRIPTAIGVDVGPERHHVVVMRKEFGGSFRVINLCTIDWDGLDLLTDRFNGTMVMDGQPEPARAIAMAQKHPREVWACFYTQSGLAQRKWDEDTWKVTIFQTEAMDQSHILLQHGRIILPRRSDEVLQFATHCHNVARRKEEDEETGNVKFKWLKLGPDHYRRAFNFAVLAAEKTSESIYSGKDYTTMLQGSFAKTYK